MLLGLIALTFQSHHSPVASLNRRHCAFFILLRCGSSESSLTACFGEELGDLSDFANFETDIFDRSEHLWIHRNGAKHSRRAVHASMLLTWATCRCSSAFVPPVATPPKATVFATKFADFLKASLLSNIVPVPLVILFIYG